MPPRRRQPTTLWRFALPVAVSLAVMLLVALVLSALIVPKQYRFVRLDPGDAKILERQYPVANVEVTRPKVASTRLDPVQGLIIEAHTKGLSEVVFDRGDGKRFHYFVEVRDRRPIAVRVRRIPRSRRRLVRKVPRPRVRRRKPERKPPKLADAKPKGQVVEIDRPLVQRRPRISKYVSEYDSSVAAETRARRRSLRRRSQPRLRRQPRARARARLTPQPRPQPKPQPRRMARQQKPTARPGKPLRNRQGRPELPRIARTPQPQPAPVAKSSPTPKEDPSLFKSSDDPGDQKIDLNPRPEVIAQAAGSAFPDHLKGVKAGDRTFLNTKAWRGASFFNRVKRAVAQHWDPASIYRRRDPYGNIYGIKDRFTLVHVTLDKKGHLQKLRVLNTSGVDFLDETATGALRAAGPFPNPPREVRDRDGSIRFSFGFYFEVSNRPLFRIFRYQ